MFAYVKKLKRGSERERALAMTEGASVTIVYDGRGKVVAAR